MGLLSNFIGRREGGPKPAPTPDSADTVQQARAKARHRLIGAVVLLLVGIVGFPLVFETQPRPTPVDIAIEIPRKENAPPLVAPAPRANPVPAAPMASAPAVASASPVAAHKAPGAGPTVTPAAESAASRPIAAAIARPPAPALAVAPAAAVPAIAARAKPVTPAPAAPPATVPDADGTRFVVQVGAFADAAAAQLMRAKAEKLGLKTYTQVTDTAAGNRVRVRIGPFATREAAEQALTKAKAGGLSAVVLTL